jgi:hypothetical protein
LDEDEIKSDGPKIDEIEMWGLRFSGWMRGYRGVLKEETYRTRLTRDELAKRRAEG